MKKFLLYVIIFGSFFSLVKAMRSAPEVVHSIRSRDKKIKGLDFFREERMRAIVQRINGADLHKGVHTFTNANLRKEPVLVSNIKYEDEKKQKSSEIALFNAICESLQTAKIMPNGGIFMNVTKIDFWSEKRCEAKYLPKFQDQALISILTDPANLYSILFEAAPLVQANYIAMENALKKVIAKNNELHNENRHIKKLGLYYTAKSHATCFVGGILTAYCLYKLQPKISNYLFKSSK